MDRIGSSRECRTFSDPYPTTTQISSPWSTRRGPGTDCAGPRRITCRRCAIGLVRRRGSGATVPDVVVAVACSCGTNQILCERCVATNGRRFEKCPGQRWFPALVAQLDRASDYGSEGWGFESLRARHCDVSGHPSQVSRDIVHGFGLGLGSCWVARSGHVRLRRSSTAVSARRRSLARLARRCSPPGHVPVGPHERCAPFAHAVGLGPAGVRDGIGP